MTIASVRFYFYPKSPIREKSLTTKLWGFAEWFECRLKPLREELRGPEVKGVNIVNFMLYESLDGLFKQNEWWRRMNTFEYDSEYDLAALSKIERVNGVEQLMAWAAPLALAAPWPQLVAVGRALNVPLTDQEKEDIQPYLRWPRGEIEHKRRR